ncbi:SUMF1/EgtB/PvdO family nonheme iron enzyme [Nitrosomonas sp.]|uniref:SUMF1/EgtB/PvdO family nonheme iron enzyme n=1 Tax=Nitrosomonas sp. TaxID=42353 RepID=UPI001E080DAD|nr:SUMF1/EgtB/PvdO family nonheme iron enzyme [Nitrosomonas sp.]MBX9636898.1 SUMF1/EgtB/PvdO family nonheme iron enzyme [Nitrosomonas sp.]MBY0484951.1 SUMF1/EgtB/PvdO family nonheme iron enzyme [Nitrosomonas sp.]
MSKIFINYRRKDSSPYAGRLYDRLAAHFGHDHVFMDIDQIEPGEVFDQVIQEKLAAVQVAVVLIGEHWLDIADANGQRRLDHLDNWVQLEIAALLERNIHVIPVLVGGAAMPKPAQLPVCLVPLTKHQGLEITDHRFHTDVDKLIKALEKIMEVPTPLQSESPKIPEKSGKPGFPGFAAIAGVVGIVLAAGIYFGLISPQPTAEQSQQATPDPINQLVTEQSNVSAIEPEMVRIPPGKFLMGSADYDDEKPQHEVAIAYAFEISKYEVTFDEYDAFAKATNRKLPDDYGWGRGKRPVINVSFDDAQAYLQWLSDKTGKQYRLPSEAEWEYAARAGTQTVYWWGNDIGENNANCSGCGSQWDSKKQTAPVGSFKPNAFGLYDTAGNVWEWTQDCGHENYQNAPNNGSAWTDANGGVCNRRVVRGGSWFDFPQYLRSAGRLRYYSVASNVGRGFRIARDF